MSLVHLEIARVRNLNTVSLDPAERINLIHGANASGKTSLLEAIHLLSMARSFRSNSIQSIIQRGQETLTVFGRVKGAAGLTSVGIEKGRQHTRIRINQQTVQKSSALAAVMPVQVINPDIHRLFEQGPRYRRQFLDWGLFHVEPAFLPVWQAYHKILRQRNAALRSGSPPGEVRYWDSQLVEQGQHLSELRRQYLRDLQPWLEQYAEKLLDISPMVSYQPGWAREYEFVDAIERSFERDRQQGFTHSGPHRADLVIRHEARPVQEHFSRGQQKLLACAMRLAQVAQYRASQAKVPVLLVDDLPAELDPERRARLMTLLVESGAQLFITATEADLISLPGEDDIKMFHVERGMIREVV
ncbi:MAG: DNA replication/repair protein RecF [Thiohalophilus sp.]|jgi:DNA replication and repair protein RecF